MRLRLQSGAVLRSRRREINAAKRTQRMYLLGLIAMASQRLTIAKVAGAASDVTLELFRSWRSARLIEDAREWSPEQWPEHVRQHADAWALKLRENSHKPPILFFAEYVDLWSYCPPERHIDDDSMLQMVADRYELFCLPLPVAAKLTGSLTELSRGGQWDEDRLFATLTLEALVAWTTMTDKAVLVFLREVLGASVEDYEVEQSLNAAPDGWESL